MRGSGFKCDKCGAKAIVGGDHFENPYASPPAGWRSVAFYEGEALNMRVEQHEFCSNDCAANYLIEDTP